jgi:hypothetical protein
VVPGKINQTQIFGGGSAIFGKFFCSDRGGSGNARGSRWASEETGPYISSSWRRCGAIGPYVVLHAPVLPATSSVLPSIATNPVASNTRPGAPVRNNSPLPSAPSHGRYILPSEKVERLSRRPTRAQVVQVTTNLLPDSCPHQPVDVVHHEDYLSFETLLMRQYVSQRFKMDECAQWKTWGRKRFCEELLKAVPG